MFTSNLSVCGMELEGFGRLGHGLRSVELTEIVWGAGTTVLHGMGRPGTYEGNRSLTEVLKPTHAI